MVPEPLVVRWVLHRALGLEPAPPAAEDWSHGLVDLNASRLLPLAHHLSRLEPVPVPEPVRLALLAARAQAEARDRAVRDTLRLVAGALDGRGLGWVVLKGLPLAERLYAGASCRPCGDVDVLVLPEMIHPAGQALEAAGFTRAVPLDPTFHHAIYHPATSGGDLVPVELHWAADPLSFRSLPAAQVLAARRRVPTSAGEVWVPDPSMERDLLLRHYVRHGGAQAILLLDLLLHLQGASFEHPLGWLVDRDLRRMGVPSRVSGPARARLRPLGRWMAARTFRVRRALEQQPSMQVCVDLALSRSPVLLLREVLRYLWPARPSARWRHAAEQPGGRYRWRLARIAHLVARQRFS